MKLLLGDCKGKLKELEDNSIDAIVTDPPYGLSFMGKKWDYDVPSVEVWQECLRVLKPGGYLLSFAGTRTQHRMAVNIEDAGFEIRDMIAWVYGSGFPKSLNIGKVMDKYLKTGNASWNGTGDSSNGALGYSKLQHKQGYRPADYSNKHQNKSEITEVKAKEWEGWGTALKPALEPITVARKPLEKGLNVAQNCLKWGVGGINIDGCRVEIDPIADASQLRTMNRSAKKEKNGWGMNQNAGDIPQVVSHTGRFPANLILDEEAGKLLDEQSGVSTSTRHMSYKRSGGEFINGIPSQPEKDWFKQETGGASRFFYCAKASKKERNMGCEGLEEKIQNNTETNSRTFNDRCLTCKKKFVGSDNTICHCPPELKITDKTIYTNKNNHPTVKPIALMEYLVKLVSREGQVVLDPFMGSGTTGMACKRLDREFIGIEMMEEYMEIAKARIEGVKKEEQLKLSKLRQ